MTNDKLWRADENPIQDIMYDEECLGYIENREGSFIAFRVTDLDAMDAVFHGQPGNLTAGGVYVRFELIA